MSDSSTSPSSSRIEPERVRALLKAERADTLARIASLSREYDGIVEANALVAVDDEHDPEGSSTAFERSHIASLRAQARSSLDDLERAAQRLDAGDYGLCEDCGGPIPEERLLVRPAASTCVRCAAAVRR
ncbi:TraR/DksA family transcriptional regulator [Streptomyces sp. NPDC086010]|uniref:TraR/DksA family transcriptional regulator n=1 Tax=Streptomyces sp. NPDC086010 TaxID=3365745 RepID=UPI0037CED09E